MSARRSQSAAETPLMQQYRSIKARHTDAILLFRMGDFYEMFYEDAEIGARELGLTLTSRNNGGASEVPLAGVPVKAVTGYLRQLVERGHRVAICEQVEDPKQAKGVVAVDGKALRRGYEHGKAHMPPVMVTVWAGTKSSRPVVQGALIGLILAVLDAAILVVAGESFAWVFVASNGGKVAAGALGGWVAARRGRVLD